jgi:hypothetical protein
MCKEMAMYNLPVQFFCSGNILLIQTDTSKMSSKLMLLLAAHPAFLLGFFF